MIDQHSAQLHSAMSTLAFRADDVALAGVEFGGTKVCAILMQGGAILDSARIPTETPAKTLPAVASLLSQWRDRWNPVALGIGSFGPISLNHQEAHYGHMLQTPKAGWTAIDILGPLRQGFDERVALHTDVTAAALAEGAIGAARDISNHVYMTVGTGIGMGIVADGRPVRGAMHPEAGHLRVRRMAGDDFAGTCPIHGDCLEGLASGPAIAARMGQSGMGIPAHDPRWHYVADALAEACAALFLTLSTERIVIGGGVGVGQPHLFPAIRRLTVEKLGGYLPHIDVQRMDEAIVPAALGGDAGPLGTLMLAAMAAGRGDRMT